MNSLHGRQIGTFTVDRCDTGLGSDLRHGTPLAEQTACNTEGQATDVLICFTLLGWKPHGHTKVDEDLKQRIQVSACMAQADKAFSDAADIPFFHCGCA